MRPGSVAIVVGDGNSAGQAAIVSGRRFEASSVLVRGDDLNKNMSKVIWSGASSRRQISSCFVPRR